MSGKNPKAKLEIEYKHTGEEKNWLINHYTSYLRVYAPKGSWLDSVEGGEGATQYGEEFGKRVFGTVVRVPVGASRTVTFYYTLPETIDPVFYDLKIQKQAGVIDPKYTVITIDKRNFEKRREILLSGDGILSEWEEK
jgi:hypothetical protein